MDNSMIESANYTDTFGENNLTTLKPMPFRFFCCVLVTGLVIVLVTYIVILKYDFS